MLAKLTSKNQITLPKSVMKGFSFYTYFDVIARDHEIVLKPVSVSSAEDRLSVVRDKVRDLGLTEKDLQNAIRWARKSS